MIKRSLSSYVNVVHCKFNVATVEVWSTVARRTFARLRHISLKTTVRHSSPKSLSRLAVPDTCVFTAPRDEWARRTRQA